MVVCEKLCYDEYKDAKSHIRGLVKRKGGNYKVYKCTDCGKFHVSTIQKRNKNLRPIKEKNYKPSEIVHPTIETIRVKKNKNKGVQESITTTYKPFEYLRKKD